jgi:hypothetical protein
MSAILAAAIGAMVLALGGMGVVPQVGVPSPPEPAMLAAAPEQCLLYISTSGTDPADPKSSNQIEQLLAEPEIKEFVSEVSRLIDEGLARIPADSVEERTLARTLPIVARTLLDRPLMLYVSKVDVPPKAPGGNAALVISAGDQLTPLVVALEELEELLVSKMPPNMTVERYEAEGAKMRRLPSPPGVPPVVWGVQGSYVFLAVGQGEAAAVAKRLAAAGPAPAWLDAVVKEAEVPRVAGIVYLNLAEILETAEPLLSMIPRDGPIDPAKVIEALGVRHLEHAAVVSGLNDDTAVSKLIVHHDGEATGLLAFLKGKPLAADDFRRIPDGVDVAFVTRFDAGAAYEHVLAIVREVEPRGVEQIEQGLKQAEDKLGFSVQDDLFGGLGDLITFYNSASEGGLFFTGFCASISVKDRGRVEKVIDKLRGLAESELNRNRPEFIVRKSEVDGRAIHYIQFVREPVPFAPCWCVTDDELIVGVTPQMVRAHLTRKGAGAGFLKNSGLDKHVARGDVLGVSYIDPKLTYQLLYSYANLGICAGASLLEKETGIRADLAKFPPYGVISRHMRPTIGISRATNEAWIGETYATGPTVGVGTIAGIGMGMALVLPAVQQARDTARSNTSMNNLRQFGLASSMYANIHGKPLPRAVTDDDGKPLLSWRVAVLPLLDRKELYDQFHLDEPWDSPHNLPLSRKMPPIFTHPVHPELAAEGKTLYQIPHGKGALYEEIAGPEESFLDAAPAGRSGTALMVEAAPEFAVVWTKPDDVEIDDANVRHRLNRERFGSSIVFADLHLERIELLSQTQERIQEMFFPRAKRRP